MCIWLLMKLKPFRASKVVMAIKPSFLGTYMLVQAKAKRIEGCVVNFTMLI